MVTKFAPAALASSTKSFHASGWSSSTVQGTLGTSSLIYALNRLKPWPSMKAVMSSLRLCRSCSIEGQQHHIAFPALDLEEDSYNHLPTRQASPQERRNFPGVL